MKGKRKSLDETKRKRIQEKSNKNRQTKYKHEV